MSSTEGSATGPQTVDEARDAVERSRERISRTLDRLEDRIVEKKHELQDKADVFRPVKDQVRRRPLTTIAVAVGIGALLGSLGGGDDDEEHRRRSGRGRDLDDDERSELRAWRKERRQRLRALGREQNGGGGHRRNGVRASSRRDSLKGQLIGAATTAITAAITSRVKDYMRGRSDDRAEDRR